MHCIRSIQLKAEDSSGITADRLYKVDEADLVERLGEATFITLSGAFYDKVYSNEILIPLFRAVEKDDMSQNLYEYLIERLGGPKYFSERKGTPALFSRHQNAPFTVEQCEIWLDLMHMTLRELNAIVDDESRTSLMDYFTYTAHSIMIYHSEAARLIPEILNTS